MKNLLSSLWAAASLAFAAGAAEPGALVHRWTFDGGSKVNSAGGGVARFEGRVKASADGKGVVLAGGAKGRSAVDFGRDLLPADGAPVTLELWLTANEITTWNEIVCCGASSTHYLVLGGSFAGTRRPFLGLSGTTNVSGTLPVFQAGEKCYFALVLAPRKEGGTEARLQKRDPATGALTGEVTVTAPRWNLAELRQDTCMLGRSCFFNDPDCALQCDEFRVWRAALTDEQILASVKAGPDLPLADVVPAKGDPELAARQARRVLLQKDELLYDWLSQDAGIPAGAAFDGSPAAYEKAFAVHGISPRPDETFEARLARYRAACLKRRAARLAPVVACAKDWVYARHYVMGGAHYAYTEGLSDAAFARHWVTLGGGLYRAAYKPDALWEETALAETDEGAYRDVDVSFDAKRLLYAYKASELGDDFHLYERDLATGETRQLTSGKGFADFEGCYLPDGRILFSSSRCSQIVDCWWAEVSNLFRIDADGSNMWRVTFDQVHDTFPALCDDGTVLYTRWEYNDRSQMYPQPLFGMAPDGTRQRAVYGANSWYPTTLTHARRVGTGPYIFAVGTGHHTNQPGELLRLDPREGREEGVGVYELEPLRPAKPVREDIFRQNGRMAMYPYPVNEDSVVLSFLPEGWRRMGGRADHNDLRANFGLYWTDVNGARELLVSRTAARAPCGRPVPVRARNVFPRPSNVADESLATGTVYVRDVYEGPAMEGVPRGLVKALRVVEIDYRHVGIGNTWNLGRGGGGISSTGPAIGGGTWDVKKVWGEVPVAADGSAAFEAPARVPFYLQLLDARGYVVQTMRSWMTLQPGESASCVGCHESANMAPPAAGEAQGKIQRGCLTRPARGFSFPRDVQPILDRRCVACHNPEKNAKIPDFTTKTTVDVQAKRAWTQAYLSLTHVPPPPKGKPASTLCGNSDHPGLNWVNSGSEPTLIPPLRLGAIASAWFTNRLEKAHCPGLTQEELRTLATWVDLGVPFGGDYLEGNTWTSAEKKLWDAAEEKRERALKTYR